MSEHPHNPAPGAGPRNQGPPPVPQRLLDAYFDRELDTPARLELFALLRKDPRAAAELERTQAAIDELREPVKAPDLTRRVLREVDRRRSAATAATKAAAASAAPVAADPLSHAAVKSWFTDAGPWIMAASVMLGIGTLALIRTGATKPAPEREPPLAISARAAAAPAPPAPAPIARAATRVVEPQNRHYDTALNADGAITPALSHAADGSLTIRGGTGPTSIFEWRSYERGNPWLSAAARTHPFAGSIPITELGSLGRAAAPIAPSPTPAGATMLQIPASRPLPPRG